MRSGQRGIDLGFQESKGGASLGYKTPAMRPELFVRASSENEEKELRDRFYAFFFVRSRLVLSLTTDYVRS
jgi:hypothetical protein